MCIRQLAALGKRETGLTWVDVDGALQGVSQGYALERSCCHSTFQCSSHRIRQARRHGQDNNNTNGISKDDVNAHCLLV